MTRKHALKMAIMAVNDSDFDINIKEDIIINSIGTAIGAHSGPGTIGIFFWGNERE